MIDGRIERANEKRAGESNLLERVPDNARTERMQVELDIWEFGQLLGVDERIPAGQTRH